MPAIGLKEEREERRRTVEERCEKVAELVSHNEPALVWCDLNDEGDMLEKMIPDAVQVSGRDNDEKQEEKLLAFAAGQVRVLITKPVIGAWGLNFQHCNHMTFFPSHSFEQYYQAVRRCWRFGQKRPVYVDTITTEGAGRVIKNRQKKAVQMDEMFNRLVSEMNNASHITGGKNFDKQERIPTWL